MGIIGFSVFKDKILDGTKAHTIRERKVPPIVGENLYLWWKPRTGDKDFLGVTVCSQVDLIQINPSKPFIQINNRKIDRYEVAKLIQADGFDDVSDFWRFFNEPLQGYLIHWNANFITRSQLRPEVIEHAQCSTDSVQKGSKIFNPSNGTEGMQFASDWCDKCDRDKDKSKGCHVLMKALIDKTPHWIVHEDQPLCVSFVPLKTETKSTIVARYIRQIERAGQLTLLNQDNAN